MINYINKYLKYKKKYVNMKYGGEIFKIPFQNIDYYDNTPPHQIPMYRSMINIYLGIMGKVLSFNDNPHNQNNQKILPTDNEQIFETSITYKNKDEYLFYFQDEPIVFDEKKNNLKYIPKSLNIYCFIIGCTSTIHMFNLDNLLIVCFIDGYVEITFHNIILDNLLNWLDNLEELIKDKKQILLCGHSNGMSAATITSFILLYLSDKLDLIIHDFYIKQNKKIFNSLDCIKSKWKKILENIEIFVVGTGGFPVIFTEEIQFIDYYSKLKGQYLLHLSSNCYIELLDNIIKKISKINTEFNTFLGKICYNYKSKINNKINSLDKYKTFLEIIKLLPTELYNKYIDLFCLNNKISKKYNNLMIKNLSSIQRTTIELKENITELHNIIDYIISEKNTTEIEILLRGPLMNYFYYIRSLLIEIISLEDYYHLIIADNFMRDEHYDDIIFKNFKFSIYSKIINENEIRLIYNLTQIGQKQNYFVINQQFIDEKILYKVHQFTYYKSILAPIFNTII